MIYYLYCGLIMTGYSACSALLGSYMMYYTGATEIDLGLIFMVQPLTVFLRPLICARADRNQSHQQMLSFFCLFTSLAYFPFIIYPFFHDAWQASGRLSGGAAATATADAIERHLDTNEILADLAISPEGRIILPEDERALAHAESLRYWLLIVFHLLGSVGWCGVRSLGDALACNYAKRIGTDFARYRKYGSISYGLCNVSLGFINQDWLLPNFVPSLMVYSASMILLSLLVWAWPAEYFVMTSKNYEDPRVRQDYIDSLPSARETARHLGNRLLCGGGGGGGGSGSKRGANGNGNGNGDDDGACGQEKADVNANGVGHFADNLAGSLEKDARAPVSSAKQRKHLEASAGQLHKSAGPAADGPALSVRQQMRIFGLLLRRDFRILLYLLVIFYGGLVGYTGPNFVFTYINVVCLERGTCNGSELCGLVISGHCVIETIVYMLVDKFRHGNQNRVLMLEITFLSLTIHYYFYGFAIEHLSPYFFLIESLHGIEYGISLSQSVELGYYFAREVELLLPELIERGIISDQDDRELVKKSLMATLSGCYTMAYEGVGTIVGCLMMGMVTGHFGFLVTWIVIGSLSAIGFVVILVGYLVGKCFKIRPEILRIRDRRAASAASEGGAAGSTPESAAHALGNGHHVES